MNKQGFATLLTIATLAGCGGSEENTEQKTLSILSQKVICEGLSQRLCLSASGQNDLAAFLPFYEDIRGFTYQWGHNYTLKVKVTDIENPPADGSDMQYSLVSIDSESSDTIGTQYAYSDVELRQHTFTEDEHGYAFLGQPFTCPDTADCDTLVSMSGSGGILDVLIFRYTGDGEIQLARWQ